MFVDNQANVALSQGTPVREITEGSYFEFISAKNAAHNGRYCRISNSPRNGKARGSHQITGKIIVFDATDYVAGTANAGTIPVSNVPEAEAFWFVSQRNPDNTGSYVRVRDTKAGKNRGLNLTNGKLITFSATDRCLPLDGEVVVRNLDA